RVLRRLPRRFANGGRPTRGRRRPPPRGGRGQQPFHVRGETVEEGVARLMHERVREMLLLLLERGELQRTLLADAHVPADQLRRDFVELAVHVRRELLWREVDHVAPLPRSLPRPSKRARACASLTIAAPRDVSRRVAMSAYFSRCTTRRARAICSSGRSSSNERRSGSAPPRFCEPARFLPRDTARLRAIRSTHGKNRRLSGRSLIPLPARANVSCASAVASLASRVMA